MSTASSLSDGNDAKSCEAINVLIAYDDLAAAQRAMRLFARLGRGQIDDLQAEDLLYQPQLWHFELLADPDWRKCAATDALRADLIVVSASSPCALPGTVQSWLTACLARKQGAHAAVVALLPTETPMEPSDCPNLRFLQSAATEAGLDFFVALRDSHAPCESAVYEQAHSVPRDGSFHSERAIPELRPPMLSQPRSLNGTYRGWGINE